MRILVIGGGIAGLAAAVEATARGAKVEVWEADSTVGGKLRTSPFAGVPAVDEGADAYLIRTSAAVEFAAQIGVTDLTHPSAVHATVWWDELHRLPGGLMLGIPTEWRELISTRLLSWPGKLRALADVVLPSRDAGDSLGALIRYRLGNQVHDRLVDTLVGSIYATDTDRASLAANPQIAALAARHRSLILGAQKRRRSADSRRDEPIFATPIAGMQHLATAAADYLTEHGATVLTGHPASSIERAGTRWVVDGASFDGVILATPAHVTAGLVRTSSALDEMAVALDRIETTDIAIVRLAIAQADWPARLQQMSGYLVPKPRQRLVTAASFGSQKWSHWGGDNPIVRVSLGRDGLPIAQLDDDQIIIAAIDETGQHIGVDIAPTAISLTRWPAGFPQYRPGHTTLVTAIEEALPVGIAVAGASYRGIGVPACIADGLRAARNLVSQR